MTDCHSNLVPCDTARWQHLHSGIFQLSAEGEEVDTQQPSWFMSIGAFMLSAHRNKPQGLSVRLHLHCEEELQGDISSLMVISQFTKVKLVLGASVLLPHSTTRFT